MLAAFGSHPVLYDGLVAAHVASALVGFGAVAMSGLYGVNARRTSRAEEVEELQRYFRSAGRVEWLVLVVPFLGAAALAVKPGPDRLGDAWVLGASATWLLAAGLLIGAVRPAERRVRQALGLVVRSSSPAVEAGVTAEDGGAGPARGPSGAGVRAFARAVPAGHDLARAAAACDVLFLVALGLMIFQPV